MNPVTHFFGVTWRRYIRRQHMTLNVSHPSASFQSTKASGPSSSRVVDPGSLPVPAQSGMSRRGKTRTPSVPEMSREAGLELLRERPEEALSPSRPQVLETPESLSDSLYDSLSSCGSQGWSSQGREEEREEEEDDDGEDASPGRWLRWDAAEEKKNAPRRHPRRKNWWRLISCCNWKDGLISSGFPINVKPKATQIV